MNGEQVVTEAVRERRRGGVMIWAEWHFGEALRPLALGRPDFLEYYGVDFRDPSGLDQWSYYMDGDLDPEDDEFVRWADTHTWHEFKSWDEAERWFEGNDEEDSLHLRRRD